MIGTIFAKPLEPDTLIRVVTRQAGREKKNEVNEQEAYDNPAPNTMKRYREAAQWCRNNRARIMEREPNEEFPNGFYEVVALPEPTPEELAAKALAQAKAQRSAAVAAITVTVDGMIFDGDEKAQERMARAVSAADSMDEETPWVLHDNTVAVVTAGQLRQALRLAGEAQTALWVKPYSA